MLEDSMYLENIEEYVQDENRIVRRFLCVLATRACKYGSVCVALSTVSFNLCTRLCVHAHRFRLHING